MRLFVDKLITVCIVGERKPSNHYGVDSINPIPQINRSANNSINYGLIQRTLESSERKDNGGKNSGNHNQLVTFPATNQISP